MMCRIPFFLHCMAMIVAALLAGCYGRTTRVYDDLPELNASRTSAIMAEAKVTEIEQEARLRDFVERTSTVEPYTINAGEVVALTVYDHPDLTMPRVLVTPDGHIGMLFVGQIKVADLNLTEAAAAIEEALSEYIKNPKVCILPLEVHSQTLTIAGSVAKPGIFKIIL